MISVIVTARNAEGTIGATIRSLLIALSKRDEVLILLDKCEDGTRDVVESFADKRIRVFESLEGLGRSRGRNFLAEQATGDYLAVLDADDISLPWRFVMARKQLRKMDAVFGGAIVFGKQLRPLPVLPQVPRSISADKASIELLGRNPLVHSTATFKRSAFEFAGGYRDSEAEEYDLWLRFANMDLSIFRSAWPVVLYRFHANQASQQEGFVERGLSCHFVISEQLKLATKLGLREQNVEQVRSHGRNKVLQSSLLARLEVLGLPEPLRRWKNRKK